MDRLEDILARREWLRRSRPFPHVVARGVFKPRFYARLCEELGEVLARGLSETADGERFSRNIANYDSYGIGFRAGDGGALGVFLSPEWRDLMADCFGLQRTDYVFAGAHHHAVGSGDGFVHNDYNPVWFPVSSEGRIQVPDHQRCDYKTGEGQLSPAEKIRVVRGTAVIFFLLNGGWRPGDGGETGLYRSGRDPPGEPSVRVPPLDNSLLAFECSPDSYHAFISNRRATRTSVIMWTHRSLADAEQRFGVERLEYWK
ncbi:2OG-Fe(II) oxygenase family protein [Nannocystis punicea]|uniref:2OG-Fe(II) oxygenase n=1 Tax=Nannocystis punicea TaxID=2995304 RepID=A0ABY7H109_9BACT|nr:2OG-Fe(II) oxygenase [Nannocystis poenicansa]WAS92938.1 2OG-Fe(II) oxygenase [Nannocystis poenicansa]